jgi:NADPH2:quinone reductase
VQLQQLAVAVRGADRLPPAGSDPVGLGGEAVGLVLAVGEAVAAFAPGDRVGYVVGVAPGAYAAVRTVPAWRCVPVPTDLPATTVAAWLGRGLLAECLVRRVFKVGAGHRVLVVDADGRTGQILAPWLRHVGATVLGTFGDGAVGPGPRACHHAIRGAAGHWPQAVLALTQQRGVDVLLGASPAAVAALLPLVRPRGTMVVRDVPAARSAHTAVPWSALTPGARCLTAPTLADYATTTGELRRAAELFFALVRGGGLELPPPTVQPLAAALGDDWLPRSAAAPPVVLVP